MQIFTSLLKKRQSRWISLALLAVSVMVLALTLAQTAQAQTTYVIRDGDQVVEFTTYATSPETVLSEAGFTLDTDDFYITQETQQGQEIHVRRMRNVTLWNSGERMDVRTASATVGQLLEEQGLAAGEDYVLSQPRSAQVQDGMELTVAHLVNATETYTQQIPYETTVLYDDTLEKGEEKIVVEGRNGEVLRTASVVYRDTEEISRTILEEQVLEQPVHQVKTVGTGEHAGEKRNKPIIGDGVIILPTGEVLTYTHKDTYLATAYTQIADVTDTTATGTKVREGVVAVDPRIIPYGTRMFIETVDGSFVYGVSTAEDCGGGIKGKRLDLYFDTLAQCYEFGLKDCTVYFLGDANWR